MQGPTSFIENLYHEGYQGKQIKRSQRKQIIKDTHSEIGNDIILLKQDQVSQ